MFGTSLQARRHPQTRMRNLTSRQNHIWRHRRNLPRRRSQLKVTIRVQATLVPDQTHTSRFLQDLVRDPHVSNKAG
jgi:hypothetical protein